MAESSCGADSNTTDIPSELLAVSGEIKIDEVLRESVKSSSNEFDSPDSKELQRGEGDKLKLGDSCKDADHDGLCAKGNEEGTLEHGSGKKKRRRGKRGKRKGKADVSETDEDCTIDKTGDAALSIPDINEKDSQSGAASELNMPGASNANKMSTSRQENDCGNNLSADNMAITSPSDLSADGSARRKNKNKKRRGRKAQTDPNCKNTEMDDNFDAQTANKTRRPKSGKNIHQADPVSRPSAQCEAFPIGIVPTRNPLTPPKVKQSPSPGPSVREKTPRKAGGRGNSSPGKSSPRSARKKYKPYEDYWTPEQVSAGLKRGHLVKGAIRISQRNYELAWVGVPGIKRDIVVDGMIARNRALHGDIVALQILARQEWKVDQEQYDEALLEEAIARNKQTAKESDEMEQVAMANLVLLTLDEEKEPATGKASFLSDMKEIPDRFLQQTAKVVFIIEKKHSRVASGHLKPFTKKPDDPDALFTPSDSRLPRIRIPRGLCPTGFFDRPSDYENTLLIARITSWPTTAPLDSFFAIGTIARSLGEAGEIEPETEAILMEYGIDSGPFSDEVLACLPQARPWTIPEQELTMRRDFRDECVFTIDPMTAHDLDDALHCKELSDGTYEVGVHIADVSYFVRPGTALDNTALERGTSTYMVQKVIPMLPRLLCEELCSLNPGKDRLCMSVVWKMTSKGEILEEWKGRGVIRSRMKMAYEHAQEMIEKPSKKWSSNELPPISDGADIDHISACVNTLHKMAVYMRHRRKENGALRLDQVKLQFDLDKETGLPNGYHVHQQRHSNRLVEEFMLLANMAVAHHIYNAFPITAVLRRHPQPHQKQLDDLIELCKSLGIDFNCNSSKSIQESLAPFPASSPEHEILVHLTMKPMKNAEYFCAGCVEDTAYGHYALSVPLYTHFTSPIRRYPDVLVHRLLAASLAIDEQVDKTSEDLDVITTHCNDRRQAAKTSGELSSEMFFGIFVRECGPLEEDGIVTGVKDQSFDVLVPQLGVTKRIYAKFCPGVKNFEFVKSVKNCPTQMRLTWSIAGSKSDKPHEVVQTLRILTRVKLILTTESESQGAAKPFKVFAKLLPPDGVSDSNQEFDIKHKNSIKKADLHTISSSSPPSECHDVKSSSPNPTDEDSLLSDQVKQQLFVSDDVMVRGHTDTPDCIQVAPVTDCALPDDGEDVIVESDSDREN